MRTIKINVTTIIMAVCAGFAIAALCGCEPDGSDVDTCSLSDQAVMEAYFVPDIRFVGLTEIVRDARNMENAELDIFIDLIDSDGARIKSPGTFRFELYHFVPRSSHPMGKRIEVWTDIDLDESEANAEHWRDFLRAYHFRLPLGFIPRPNDTFVLQATFMTPNARRLSATFHLKATARPWLLSGKN